MLHFIAFCFTLWFGAYLLAHDARKPTLRWTGCGLISYATALAADVLITSPEFSSLRWIPVGLTILFWAASVAAIYRLASAESQRSFRILIGVVTLFFGLGVALLILPLDILPGSMAVLAISIDMVLLGFAVIRLDAFEEGQRLFRAALWSLSGAALVAVLIGGQIALIGMITARGQSDDSSMIPLLIYSLTGTAILLHTFANGLAALFDRLAFAQQPAIQQERADLRAAEQSVALRGGESDLAGMDDATFVRLTRRALSAYGDLKRLAGSPLIDLPIIHARLRARGASDNTLERAAELKTLLTESIDRLKPRDGAGFGTSDEWHYYNAVYFIYIAGLRPYSVRADPNGLSTDERAALAWFREQIPERTLYNWQNAAAKLIADDVRERSES